jgi:uncharacterized protein YndB with AHSA1/START domain
MIRNELEVPIEASSATVWQSLFEEIDAWWHPDFYMAGEPHHIAFEPKLGGRLYELTEQGSGLTWYQVIAIEPGKSVTLAGTFAPPFAGPATNTMHLSLEPKGDGQTVLRLSESVFGNVSEKMKTMLEEGWKQLFEGGLKKHVESK